MAKMDSFKKATENAKAVGFKKAQSNVVNLAAEFGKRDIVIGNTGIEK